MGANKADMIAADIEFMPLLIMRGSLINTITRCILLCYKIRGVVHSKKKIIKITLQSVP